MASDLNALLPASFLYMRVKFFGRRRRTTIVLASVLVLAIMLAVIYDQIQLLLMAGLVAVVFVYIIFLSLCQGLH